jgi:adenosylcobinamide kinase / adenosylcobinamide-phosphate guanylyltransferase
MNKIILILGGARSGKSTYAAELAGRYKKVAFIATGEGLDSEMKKRIKIHKESRPKTWKTFEEPTDISGLLTDMEDNFECTIIDCMTLLVSNLILNGEKEKRVLERVEKLFVKLKKRKGKIIIVSNEVGLGLVPANKLGRVFRDIAGKVNQLIAKKADQVFLTVSGIPVKIKGEK